MTFQAEITWFERKTYASLSHEANKAMNLNAYIALMGTRRIAVRGAGGVHLVTAGEDEPAREFPDASYVLTLDADSLLLPGYASRLIAVMQTPGNERVAVAQTPYSAIPGAPSPVERVAGATTDIQYIVHQGFAANDAAYWVGGTDPFWTDSNAALRQAFTLACRRDPVCARHPGEAMGRIHRLVERVGLHPARPPLGLPAADDQTRALEHLQVARDRGQAHRERLGQLADCRLPLREARQDRAARGIGECGEGPVELLILNHVVQYTRARR